MGRFDKVAVVWPAQGKRPLAVVNHSTQCTKYNDR